MVKLFSAKTILIRTPVSYTHLMPDLMEGLDVLAALKGTDRVLSVSYTHLDVYKRQH